MAKFSLSVIFFLIGLFSSAQLSAQPTPEDLFKYKEKFTYEVKYSFLKLGWVEVEMMPDTLVDGKTFKYLKTTIRSNSKVPLVGREIDEYHSLFYINDDGIPVTEKYWKNNIDENIYEEIVYEFDRENEAVYYVEEDGTNGTMDLEEPATAGHIIFFFSRLFAGSDIDSRQVVYISKDIGYLEFENASKTERRNYKPFDNTIDAVLTRGRTVDLEGPFGFSGKFRAWFLDDELRVPLEARVRVFFGNAIVRLVEYERTEL